MILQVYFIMISIDLLTKNLFNIDIQPVYQCRYDKTISSLHINYANKKFNENPFLFFIR